MSDVIDLPVITTLDIPPEKILNSAIKAEITTAVVVGWDKNGELYFTSSVSDGGEVLWLLEIAKKALMDIEL